MESIPMPGGWPHFLSAMLLVLVRLSGLMVFAPVFSSGAIPARVKILFALAVAVLLAPVVAGLPSARATVGVLPVLGELAAGLLYGLSLALVAEMLTFAGQVIGMQFSFSLVNLLDPSSQVETPLLGHLFGWMGTLVVLAAGLHRTLLASFIRSFQAAPVGTLALDLRSGPALVAMAGGIFLAALQLAAPVIAATLLVELAIALAGRLSPQLPVLSLTIPAKTLLGYVVLIGSLAVWPRFIEARFLSLLELAEGLVRHCVQRV